MSEETETVEIEETNSSKLEKRIVELEGELKVQNQKWLDSNEENMRRRKANERLKGEIEELKNAPPISQVSNEEVIAQLNTQHKAELDAERAKTQKLAHEQAITSFQTALLQENIMNKGLKSLTAMAKSRIGFDENGNIRIMAEDSSKPLAGSGSDGYATIGDLAKELAASDTGQHFIRDAGVSGGGKPPASSNGRLGTKQSVTRSQFELMTQRERSLHSTSGGKVVYG